MLRRFFSFALFSALICCLSYFSLNAHSQPSAKHSQLEEEPIFFFVVIPSYNNALWVKENLESLARQTYPHWKAYYINDASTDETGAIAEQFVKDHKLEDKITLIHNKERKGALANTYHAIHSSNPRFVVVMLDGDDQLLNDGVLKHVAKVYKKHLETWLTYGTYVSQPHARWCICKEFSDEVKRKRTFRKDKFRSGHLRTFYAGLFHLIKKEDLQKDGEFLPSAGDVATMIPMLEMAAKGHFRYIKEVLYLYRDNNPINDFRNGKLQRACVRHVRKLTPYKALDKAPWLE